MDRFLIIQLARLGDLLQSSRLVRTLRQRGETHLCVDRSLAALAERLYPGIVVHALHAHAGSQDHSENVLEANWRTVAELAGIQFSGVYNLNHAGMNRALSGLFAPEILHGHAQVRGQAVRSRWLDLAFRGAVHRRSAPINLVDIWAGLVCEPMAPEAVNPPALPGGRGLGVALAGREARRSLPPAVLGPCILALFERLGGPDVWFFGSEAERPLARRLLRHLPARVLQKIHDLSGQTRLTDLPDALAGLDALLTPDTGLMHLAAWAGVPVHAMFLSSAWAWETGPYGLGHIVWQADRECAPCLEAVPCAYDRACLLPFGSTHLLNALAGRRELPPQSGVWRLESSVDALGIDWEVREGDADADAGRRQTQRRLLAEYLGLVDARGHSPATGHFYQEADWMLPDPLP